MENNQCTKLTHKINNRELHVGERRERSLKILSIGDNFSNSAISCFVWLGNSKLSATSIKEQISTQWNGMEAYQTKVAIKMIDSISYILII